MHRSAIAVVLTTWALLAGAAAPRWQPVPGAPEIEVDTGSIDAQRGLVTAGVRLAGGSQVLRGSAFEPAGRLPPHHRRVVAAQFDCQRRTVRALGTQASDARGRALYLASVAGAAVPLPADEGLDWLYDALCEMARAAER